jgi:hypothetical protein
MGSGAAKGSFERTDPSRDSPGSEMKNVGTGLFVIFRRVLVRLEDFRVVGENYVGNRPTGRGRGSSPSSVLRVRPCCERNGNRPSEILDGLLFVRVRSDWNRSISVLGHGDDYALRGHLSSFGYVSASGFGQERWPAFDVWSVRSAT